MKKLIIVLILSIFLISSVLAQSITSYATENEDENDNKLGNSQQGNIYNVKTLTQEQIQSIITARNRIRANYANNSECPEACSCEGSAVKCKFANGTKEMTINAGNSGNTIVQVKGVNASTSVTLYKSDEKVYGVFKNNETKEINVFPDDIQERIREKINTRLENQDYSNFFLIPL